MLQQQQIWFTAVGGITQRNTMDKFGMKKWVEQKSSLNLVDTKTAQQTGISKVLCFSTGKWTAEAGTILRPQGSLLLQEPERS